MENAHILTRGKQIVLKQLVHMNRCFKTCKKLSIKKKVCLFVNGVPIQMNVNFCINLTALEVKPAPEFLSPGQAPVDWDPTIANAPQIQYVRYVGCILSHEAI